MYPYPTGLQFCKPYTLFFIFIVLFSSNPAKTQSAKPNVILILADDIGYEVPTVNGGQSYSTPNIDYLAQHGMNFKHCEASPLCSPSRIMLLTGKYSFRNYSIWGWMNKGEKTIGNLLKDAGYSTGWFGKLQLLGHDSDIQNFGFEKYVVFEPLDWLGGSRYKNPRLYKTGEIALDSSLTNNKYADDILTDSIFAFIDSNRNKPFFAYYSMSLAHAPFSPTPDDSAFASWNPLISHPDTSFFPSMVKYMDKKVGQIIKKLKDENLDQNTIIIFCGDNGTSKGIISQFNDEEYVGEKSTTTEAGTHVPLMAYWPGHIAEGSTNDNLVDFTDFLPTLAEISGTTNLNEYKSLDGKSFYPNLLGNTGILRDWVFCHFDAWPGVYSTDTLNRWIQNANYKLYDNTGSYYSGKFYNILTDKEQRYPLPDSLLTTNEVALKNYFLSILDTMPKSPATPSIVNAEVSDITSTSVILKGEILATGGSAIKERGSLWAIYPATAFFNNNRKADSLTGSGSFQVARTKLKPQKHYSFSLYAMNENKSNNTGYLIQPEGFFTLSNPPILQPTYFAAIKAGCSLSLKWLGVKFPLNGATQAGYLVIYSTKIPAIITAPNQKAPTGIVTEGRFIMIKPSTLPNLPPSTLTIPNLSSDSIYNFLLIPYTWDGVNTATYNYLTAGARTISATPLPSQITLTALSTKPLCSNSNDGIIAITAAKGLAPYFYSINGGSFNSAPVFNNLTAGPYTVIVKDSAGCTATKAVTIITPKALIPVAIATKTSCITTPDGSISLTASGGTTPYLYSLDGSTYGTNPLFTNLLAKTYNPVVKDALGCTATKPVTVTAPKALLPVATSTPASCFGVPDGTIKLTVTGGTGPYLYSLDGSTYGTGSLFANLLGNAYNPVVKDAVGCTATKPVTVIQPKALAVTLTKISASCKGAVDGSITVAAKGGTAPYMYSLNGGAYTSATVLNNLSAGSYTIAVKDANGCTYTVTTALTQVNKTCVASLAAGTQSAASMVAESNLRVSVSPNPGLYQFTLTVNGNLGAKVLIRVSDVYGKTLHTAEALTNSTYKFGNNLLAGIYFVQVVQGKNVKTLKVIKGG